MDAVQEILHIIKKIGIPVVIFILIVGSFVLYRNWLEIRLLNLSIKQAKRYLGEEKKDDKP